MTPEAAILAGLSAAQYRPGMTVVRFRFSLSLSLSLSRLFSIFDRPVAQAWNDPSYFIVRNLAARSLRPEIRLRYLQVDSKNRENDQGIKTRPLAARCKMLSIRVDGLKNINGGWRNEMYPRSIF